MKSPEIYYHDKNDVVANICHNVQEIFEAGNVEESYLTQPFHNLLYHDVFLPKGADKKFQNYKVLWETVLKITDEDYHLYKALHFIIPLSKDASLSGNIELCWQIATTHFVNRGFAVQVDLHSEDELDCYAHAHLLVAPYRFSQKGGDLGSWEDIGLLMRDGY